MIAQGAEPRLTVPECRVQGVRVEGARRGLPALQPEEVEALRQPLLQRYREQSDPYYATARLWDDGILDPPETRRVLGLALSACLNAPIGETRRGVLRM